MNGTVNGSRRSPGIFVWDAYTRPVTNGVTERIVVAMNPGDRRQKSICLASVLRIECLVVADLVDLAVH